MPTELSFLHIPIIFLIGLIIANKTAKKIKSNIIIYLFFMHMFFSYLYYQYAINYGADANVYFLKAENTDNLLDVFKSGTSAIIFIAAIFTKYLQFSKLTLFFLFGLFGYIGFVYLIKMFESNKIKILNIPVIYLVLFLPGFHFWTSALGKDSIIFMLIMMFFYSIKNIKRNLLLVIISFTVLTFIRPYLGMIILISSLFALFLRKPTKIKFSQFVILAVVLIVLITLLPFFIDFLQINSLSVENIANRTRFYNEYGANRTDGMSSYIDVSNYSLPNKLFAYFFRPIFFDAHSPMQLMASFENLFLLTILIKWMFSIKFRIIKWYTILNITEKIMFFFVLIGWILFASSMYNLGLASRQKYMLLPVLLILILKNLTAKQTIIK